MKERLIAGLDLGSSAVRLVAGQIVVGQDKRESLQIIGATEVPSQGILKYLASNKGILIYIAILLALAFFEEYLWEITVWNEQFTIGGSGIFETWHFLLVPLLVVPQFTHYVLDGFIWKSKKEAL